MKTLGWPPNYVARCPVKLFEASGGSTTWMPSGTSGELNMKPLGNMMLHFQLRDLLDNQILFEHTMRKPEAFMVLARRFFVIRLENGSFRGFGFTDDDAASEMKKQVQKAVKPFTIRESVDENFTDTSPPVEELTATPSNKQPQTPTPVDKSSTVVSYESVPRRPASVSCENHQEQPSSTFPTLEITTFNAAPKSSIFLSKWKVALKSLTIISPLKGLSSISQMFGWKEHEMEIGYPTDVKHVAHIGWDGPSVGAPNWIDEIKPSLDFSSGPLREFGQPRGPDWIHDALSAAKWTAPGIGANFNPPPKPPAEFLDSDKNHADQKGSKWKVFGSRQKSKAVPK